jgi:hypothetical protein
MYRPRADQTRNRLKDVFVIDYFFGGPALHSLAGVRTAIKKRCLHWQQWHETPRRAVASSRATLAAAPTLQGWGSRIAS